MYNVNKDKMDCRGNELCGFSPKGNQTTVFNLTGKSKSGSRNEGMMLMIISVQLRVTECLRSPSYCVTTLGH